MLKKIKIVSIVGKHVVESVRLTREVPRGRLLVFLNGLLQEDLHDYRVLGKVIEFNAVKPSECDYLGRDSVVVFENN